jgi:hypothetical protein
MSAVILMIGLTMAPGLTRSADGTNNGAAGDWLARYADARSVGLGGAMVAVADEPIGVMWNPAGVGRLNRNGVQLGTVQLFEGTSINSLSFAVPNRRLPSFGITLLSLSSGDFEQTNELNERLGDFAAKDFAFLLTGALNLSPRWAVGANFKVVRQSSSTPVGSGLTWASSAP